MPELTEEQKDAIRQVQAEWQRKPPPCGIPHDDDYNPCLPERVTAGLMCLTCGARRRA